MSAYNPTYLAIFKSSRKRGNLKLLGRPKRLRNTIQDESHNREYCGQYWRGEDVSFLERVLKTRSAYW